MKTLPCPEVIVWTALSRGPLFPFHDRDEQSEHPSTSFFGKMMTPQIFS